MPTVIKTPRARKDLVELADYIARDSVDAAIRWLDRMDQRLALLASQPDMGERRPEIASDIRSFVAGAYVVFYYPRLDGIEVIRVLHSARDVDPLA